MKTDVTDLIERMPACEARTGVRIEGVYAQYDADPDGARLEVRGELHAASGGELDASVDLMLTAHDDRGRVVATTTTWFNAESFFGFEPFDLSCFDLPARPAKLRLYPKLG